MSVLAYDGMSAFGIGIVTEVFGLPRPEFDVPWYELIICAEAPGSVRVIGGASRHTPYGLDTFAATETVIVPGVPDVTADPSPELVAALGRAYHCGVQASLDLLETTGTPIEQVAEAVGFDTAVTYRHHFNQIMRTSPSAYRRAFHTGETVKFPHPVSAD